MKLHRITGSLCFLLFLLASCSAPPVTREVGESLPYVTSRDSVFRYRVPDGWFDATGDDPQSNRVVWIVRGDYAGTIFIREVYLDDAARRGLTRGGLMSIARLTSSLEAASRRGMIVLEPRPYELAGGEACLYEMDERGEDRVRTILLNVSGTLYAVTAMAGLSLPEETRGSIFSAHDAFASVLRWTPKAPVPANRTR
jgi:hypothetical protein